MSAKLRLKGKKFFRLTVLREAEKKKSYSGNVRWVCRCDCGKVTIVPSNHLRSGHTKSCGCWNREVQLSVRHGHKTKDYTSPTYKSWSHMKSRCSNSNDPDYKNYGGRGISFCSRWCKFENFLADMGEVPKGFSLERKDTNGNYNPGNCIWIPKEDQSKNRRNVPLVSVDGKSVTIPEAAKHYGFKAHSIRYLMRHGFSFEEAIRRMTSGLSVKRKLRS